MKKKVLSMILSAVMMASVFAGCGKEAAPTSEGTTNTETTDTKTTDDKAATTEETVKEEAPTAADIDISEPVTLKWYLHGSSVTDAAPVLEKANEYLAEKLNVTLEPIWGTWGDFDDGVTLALNGGDDVDIYFTAAWGANEYNNFAKKGYYVKLDDPANNLIEKYAPDLWAALPSVLIDGATIEGSDGKGIYAVPTYKDIATQNCWDVNVTLLEKYGYTIDDIKGKTYYEFGDIFETVKKGEGDSFYPLLVEGAVLERMVTNSIIVTGDAGTVNLLSHYIDPVDPSKEGPYGNKILNKFATDEYKKFVEKTREYYLAGYIDPACANAQQANDVRTAKQLTGEYLIGTQSYALGYEVEASALRGIEVQFVPCTAAYVDTTASQGAMMAISATSKNPERAMMFLNLLNTDPYLMTLLNYGVEGVHYNLNDDGLVVFTDKRADYTPWRNGMGNVTILPAQEGEGVGFWDEFKAYYGSAKQIPILGYALNQTEIETEIAGLANIAGEYALALSTGSIDPATKLPEFLDKLEKAGMQKVVDAANTQLEAFLKMKSE